MATDSQLLSKQTIDLTAGSLFYSFDVARHSVCTVQLVVKAAVTGTWVVTVYRSNDGVNFQLLETTITMTNGGVTAAGAMSVAFASSGFRFVGLKVTTACAAGSAEALICGKADT